MPKKNETHTNVLQKAQNLEKPFSPSGNTLTPEVLVQLKIAMEHHGKGEISKAVEIYKGVLKDDPENHVALDRLGLVAHHEGQLNVAVQLIQKSVQIKPDYDVALGNLGNVLVTLGRYEEAVSYYERAVNIKPKLSQLRNALGIALKACGRLREAIDSYDFALASDPNFAEAHNNKGSALVSSKMFDEAIICFKRAIIINPHIENVHNNLGLAYVDLEKYADAEVSFLMGLKLNPQNDITHYNLGNAKRQQGMIEDAIDCYRNAITINPTDANYYKNLGMVFKEQGVFDQAIEEFLKAIKNSPYFADAYGLLGDLFTEMNQPNKAIDIFKAFLNVKFDSSEKYLKDISFMHNRLGLLFKKLSRMNEALQSYKSAIAFDPENADAHGNLGTHLFSCGYLDEAMTHFVAAINLIPKNPGMVSNKLFSLNYFNGQSSKTLYPDHLEWENLFAKNLKDNWPQHQNSRDPERQLRIGFVSPDLGQHPVGNLVLGLLENLSLLNIVTICYSSRREDKYTGQFIAAANIWRDVYKQSHNVLANMILVDEVDILIDLSGHTADNRLIVFANKPAPIQMSWAGYVGTTGLSAMDYILSDKYSIRRNEEQYYKEKVLRMPDGWVCYSPPKHAPMAGARPCEKRGFVTFASFSNPAKINVDVIATWSEILKSVPSSQLLLKYNAMNSDVNLDRLFLAFGSNGIDSSRITLEGWSSQFKMLERYNDVDISLDTFPYSGGVTTFEALWMGVPVLTFPGKTFASRHSQSHLSTIGLPELIAKNRPEYVRLAIELANDTKRLMGLSQKLRLMMAASPSCDGAKFARNFENVIRGIWHEWCFSQ